MIEAELGKLPPAPATPKETTVGGNVKEFFKGIVPGAIGLAESAAVGASALLPEDTERAARESIKSTAAAARKPFEAGAGYEESIGRKFGEAVGSTIPFLASAPLGVAGRIAGTALGVGAGAGEARGRAEEGGADAGDRGLATGLGAVVGTAEMFAPVRILGRLADPIKQGAVAQIKRALVAGGEEGAQEAASQVAQNLIAKGIYKPEQEIIEQVGESAAYGGATGALVQGLLDMALGRRVKGAASEVPDAEQRAQAERERREQLKLEQGLGEEAKAAQAQGYVGQQGQLFRGLEKPTEPQRTLPTGTDSEGQILEPAPDEAAPRPSDLFEGMPLTTEVAQEAGFARTPEELEAAGQQQLGLEQAQDTEFFQQELDMLNKEYATLQEKKGKTPADNQRMRDIRTRRTQVNETIKQREADRGPQLKQYQDQGALFTPAELRKGERSFTPITVPPQSPVRAQDVSTQEQSDLMLEATFEYADLVKMREQLKAAEQTPEIQKRIKYLDGQIRDYTLAGVDQAYQQRVEREATEGAAAEQQAREAALAEQSAFAQQPDGQPVPEPTVRAKPTPETAPTLMSPDVLGTLGIGHSALLRKPSHPIHGLDITKPEDAAEVKKMLSVYKEGKSEPIVQKVDAYLARPEFQGVPDVPTTTAPQPAPEVSDQPGGRDRGMEVSVPPATTELSEPGPGAAPTTEATATPDGLGLVPTGPDAGEGDARVSDAQPAVTAGTTPTERQQRIAFGKGLGAAQPYPGSLRGRVNKAAQTAAKQGDFPGVVSALEKSKNATIAEVARRAKSLNTKIEIDDLAGETYEGRSAFQDQMSIDGAKMHLEALDNLRELAPQVGQMPQGTVLPYSISGASVKAISQGEELATPLPLRNIVENNNSMFSPLGLPETRALRTKEDFESLLAAFERATQEVGEPALRLTASASAIQQGVAGAYNADTDTITVPEYFAKDEAVLAHEIVHAQVLQAVANPTLAQRPVVQRLNKLFEHVKESVDSRAQAEEFFRKPYGAVSVQEFIAEGLSNPDFQFTLSRIPYENTSAWDKFVDNIAKLLGLKNDTAFTELLGVYGELTQPAKAKPKAAPAPAATKPKKAKKPAGVFDALLQPGETVESDVEAMAEKMVAKEKPKAKSPFDISGPSTIGAELQADADSKKRRSVSSAAEGQTLASMQAEVARMPGLLGAALRRMLKSGKVKLEAASPDGRKVGGLYDGKAVTLYANGIPEGKVLAVALHEVGAHLGMKNLVGAKQYDAIIDRLQRMVEKADGSVESKMAQAAYKRIPIRDMKRGPEVFGDELLAYFVEEMALSEAAGSLPKVGALRNMYNQIKTGILTALNRVFGASLGINSLTAEQIQIIAKAAFTKESYTAATGEASAESSRNSIPAAAELDVASRAAIKALQDKLPVSERGPDGMVGQAIQGMQKARESSGIITTFRQAAADKFASVESKVSQMFSKGVRDSFGNLNPMVLARQAEDNAKIIMDFFRAGGIRVNKEGLVETFDQDTSMVSALNKVKEFAAANNMTYEEAKAEISTVLEGHRVHGLRQYNNELEQSAIILAGQGKTKEAAEERARKIKLYMTDAEIDQMESIYQKAKGIQDIQSDLNATRTQAIDLMVSTGRITEEQGQFWKANEDYVPFDRVFEDGPSVPKFVRGKGLAVLDAYPGMKGSLGRPVRNVLDAYANRLSGMVEDTMRNNASVKLLETMELGGFAREIPNPAAAQNENLVIPRLFRDGKPVHFEVQNEYDMLAFMQAPEIMNGLTKALGATARVLRLSITAMPPFAIKQVVDDAQRAAFYSGVERPLVVAMKTLYNFPKVFFGELTGRKSVAVKRMEELGIIGDYDFNIYEPVADIEKEIGATKRGVAKKVFHRLEQLTKASDLAARLAVYEETMRETKGDELLAQTRARELINFTRRGSSPTMRTAARVIPFFNAYAQGMDVLYRSATGLDGSSSGERSAARKMFMSRVAIMTAFGFAYALAMSDDEGYENATDEVRDNNWLLPGGFKIPVPKELAFIFKSIPERVIQYINRSGTEEEQAITAALGSVVKAALSAYGSPTAVPSFVRPILENMTNYSFFLQRELESASMQRREPGFRSTSATSELAKALGETTNVSPIKIDNFLRGTFGMAGSTTLLMTDALLNPTRPDRPLYQMPFTSIFLYDTVGGRNKVEFYQLREKVGQADSTFKDLLKTDPAKAEKFLEANEALISAAPLINDTLRDLSQLRALRTMVEQGTEEMLGMSSEERRELIDEIRGSENELVSYTRELEKALRE